MSKKLKVGNNFLRLKAVWQMYTNRPTTEMYSPSIRSKC